jgi:hypothetical protein
MAKARKKKGRKPAKRAAKKRKVAVNSKARRPAKKARRRPAKPASFVEAVADAAREARELRSRLAGHNTFED